MANNQRADLDTRCRNGHPRTPESTYVNPRTGVRTCRECARRWQRDVGLLRARAKQPRTRQ